MNLEKERFNHDEAVQLLKLEKDLDLIRNCNRRLICAIRFENYDRIIALSNEIIYSINNSIISTCRRKRRRRRC